MPSAERVTSGQSTSLTRLMPYIVSALLIVQTILLGFLAMYQSPNANEPGHLAAGVSHWELGRFELYRVNPPLVRMLGALPVLLAEPKMDWSNFHEGPGARPIFTIGPDFMRANGKRSFWLMTLARWACIPLVLAGGLVCFFWARSLYGELSGLLVLTLWCFSPTILGQGAFLTPDAAATSMSVVALWLYWRWLKQPTWTRAFAAGCLLGIAELTKSTLILYFGFWPLIWVFWILTQKNEESNPRYGRQTLQLTLILLLALHLLNLGYGYDGSFRPLGKYEFMSEPLRGPQESTNSDQTGNRFRGTLLEKIPVPLPAQYVMGIDIQKHDFERKRLTFFRGKIYEHGFWYYYLYALTIKVPLGTWLLALLAVVVTLVQSLQGTGSRWRDEMVLLAPLVLLLVFVSSETDYNAHLRYILPIFPLAMIWISKAALLISVAKPYRALLIGIPVAWTISASLWIYPHSLAYFNELAGGPAQGYRHLINSNLDWGQDLHELKGWLDQHPDAQPFFLAYYGLFDPHLAGIEFQLPAPWAAGADLSEKDIECTLVPGWYAISVNHIYGLDTLPPFNARGVKEYVDPTAYRYFLDLTPVARAGYSIHIYRITQQDIDRLIKLRHEREAPPVGKAGAL